MITAQRIGNDATNPIKEALNSPRNPAFLETQLVLLDALLDKLGGIQNGEVSFDE